MIMIMIMIMTKKQVNWKKKLKIQSIEQFKIFNTIFHFINNSNASFGIRGNKAQEILAKPDVAGQQEGWGNVTFVFMWSMKWTSYVSQTGWSPLMKTAMYGYAEAAELLIYYNADLDAALLVSIIYYYFNLNAARSTT